MVRLQTVQVHNGDEKSKRETSNSKVVALAGVTTPAKFEKSQEIQPVGILLGSKTIMSDTFFYMSQRIKVK